MSVSRHGGKCCLFPNIDTTHCEGRFRQVVELAKLGDVWHGKRGLRRQLMYLATYANRRGCSYDRRETGGTRCTLFNDHAALSFGFTVERWKDGIWQEWFHGGLIYSGPGVPLDGSAPALTVSLAGRSGPGWSVHT